MMSKFATPVAFFAGLAVGGATAWYCAKEKYCLFYTSDAADELTRFVVA